MLLSLPANCCKLKAEIGKVDQRKDEPSSWSTAILLRRCTCVSPCCHSSQEYHNSKVSWNKAEDEVITVILPLLLHLITLIFYLFFLLIYLVFHDILKTIKLILLWCQECFEFWCPWKADESFATFPFKFADNFGINWIWTNSIVRGRQDGFRTVD